MKPSSTYLKVEREERELSLLMALRVCNFYQLDLHEFISMLSDEELQRQDYSVIRVLKQRERKNRKLHRQKLLISKASNLTSHKWVVMHFVYCSFYFG